MRDVVASVVALLLVLVAASLATALTRYRQGRVAARRAVRAQGERVVAEVPSESEMVLFCEGSDHFRLGSQLIPKDRVRAVRVLVNGSPIAAYVSTRYPEAPTAPPASFEDRPEGIARDRWDVALETAEGTTLVECGAIRERISQELARAVFDAVKTDLERRDAGLDGAPPAVPPAGGP